MNKLIIELEEMIKQIKYHETLTDAIKTNFNKIINHYKKEYGINHKNKVQTKDEMIEILIDLIQHEKYIEIQNRFYKI